MPKIEDMTNQDIDKDERLQVSVALDRFTGFLQAPYEGREFGGDETVLQALSDAALIRDWLDREVPRLVKQARKDGASWREIGYSLNLTRQGAQQRFGA